MSESTEPDLKDIYKRLFIKCNYMEALKNTSEGKIALAEARVSLDYNMRAKYTSR